MLGEVAGMELTVQRGARPSREARRMNEHETVGRIGASGLAVALLALAAGTASAQPLQLMVMSDGTELDELRRVDVLVDSLVRADELVATSRQPDPQVPGREHESLKQFHEGVPVDGGGVSRQLARGVTVCPSSGRSTRASRSIPCRCWGRRRRCGWPSSVRTRVRRRTRDHP